MGFSLSTKSQNKLIGVHPTFIELINKVSSLSPYEFYILRGVSTAEEQYQLYLKGQKGTGYPTPCDGTKKRSSHQASLKDGYGHAVDIAITEGDPTRVKISEVSKLFFKVAFQMGITIRWGGNFKKRDWGHFDFKGSLKVLEGEETTEEELTIEQTQITSEEIEKEKLKSPQYYFYTITRDSELISNGTCIGDKKGALITFSDTFTFENFLNLKSDIKETDGSTPTNWDRIRQTYVFDENSSYTKNSPLIKRGTKVLLPSFLQVKIDIEESSVNKDPDLISITSFINEKEQELVNDPYFDSRLKKIVEKEEAKGEVLVSKIESAPYKTEVTCTVWIYSQVEKKLFNLSSKVKRLVSLNSLRGSSFELHLGDFSFEGEVYRDHLGGVSVQSLKYKYDQEISYFKTLFDFTRIFSRNDIVYLKFSEIDSKLKDFIEISASNLTNKIYDFIGLVDTVKERVDYQRKEVTVDLTGSDLSRLFEDDAAKFFPLALTENLNNRLVLGTGGLGEKLLKRTFLGEYLTLFSKTEHSVGETFQWYLSLLSNLGILSDEESSILFSNYGDRRQYRDKDKNILQSGIYQILKLVVDSSIVGRKLVDFNAGSPDGNFAQLFDNLCISPYVEWYIDTYSDMINLVVRQPPYTKSLIKAYLNKTNPSVYRVIRNEFLVDTSLEFSSEIYTWYQLTPKGYFWGVSNQTSMDFLPVIQLDEFVNKWGSKCYELSTNYIDINTSIDSRSQTRLSEMHKKSIEDLLILIESSCYLPFTRKGKIELSIIDRSFRKGTFCYLEKTGEIFYIEEVSHDITFSEDSTEGVTTLTVSRGMVFDFIEGVKINDKLYSYFSIVDLDLIKSTLYTNYNLKKEFSSKKGSKFVDKEIFDFFLSKKQYLQVGINLNF